MRRKPCPASIKDELLERQGYVCAYCLLPFGCVINKGGRRLALSTVQFDHVIPYAYLNDNHGSNWVAACNFCNSMKSDDIFESFQAIRDYIDIRWTVKNMTIAWMTPVSSEENPELWAVKFGTYLASRPRGSAPIPYRAPRALRRKRQPIRDREAS